MKSIIIQPSHVRGLGNILDNEDNIQGLHCRVEAQDNVVEFDDLELKTYYMGTGTQLNIRFILDTISILPEQTVHVDVLVTDDENNPVSGVDLYIYESNELISQMETDEDGYGVEDGSLGFNFTSEDVGKHTLKCVIPRQDLYYESKNELVINVLQETTLTLTIDPDEIDTLTDTITLYGTLLNEEGEPVVGEIITFYDNTTLLGWSITNDLGVATLVVNIEDIQDLGLVPYIGIDWIKTSDNPNNHTEDGSLYVSATISNTGIAGLPLTILVNNTVMFEGVTDSTGHADLLDTTLNQNAVVTVITKHTNLYNATTKQYRLGESEKIPTITSLSVSSSTVSVGTNVTFTATVTDEDDEPIEGLTVTFKDGGSSLGTGTTNSSGVATLSSSSLAAGNHSVTAETSEDNTYSGSTSTAVTVTVNKLATSTSLSLGSNTIYVDGSTTATATVTSGGNGVNGLTVTFKDGSTTLGTSTTNSSGIATYTISGLNAGNHSITAVVTENSTYAASTSSAVTLTVNNHSYSLAFSAASYVATGGSATLECTLLDNNVPVEGATISVTGSDSSLYTGITNTNGIATVTVTVNANTDFTCTYNNVSDTTRVNYMAYQTVEYLQSNGSQYINTGYILKANDKVEVTVSMQGSGQYNGVFGARKNDYEHNAYALFGRFGSQNKFVYTRTGDERSGNTIRTNVIYDVTTDGSTCTIMQGDTLVQTLTNTGTVEDCVNPCGLFVLNTYNGADGFNKDTYGYMKIYSFKITDSNDNVVMDLIPVREGTTGYMYDKVTGDVLTNYGTFLYGEDI